jgi:hypothetical protein
MLYYVVAKCEISMKPKLEASASLRHLRYKEKTSRILNYRLLLIAVAIIATVMVVLAVGCIVKHLHPELRGAREEHIHVLKEPPL